MYKTHANKKTLCFQNVVFRDTAILFALRFTFVSAIYVEKTFLRAINYAFISFFECEFENVNIRIGKTKIAIDYRK